MKIINSRKLVGKAVYSQDGVEVGEVQGVDVDTDTWRIQTFELRLLRDVLDRLELKKPIFGTQVVRVEVSRIAGVTDTVILHDKLARMQFVEVVDD